MTMFRFFNLMAAQHESLQQHLFPGDGKEAIAIILCGRAENSKGIRGLMAHEICLLPHEKCERDIGYIRWPTLQAWPLIERALTEGMSIAKIHCHPGGEEYFSRVDDVSDKEFFGSLFGWSNGEGYHASLIMLPCGKIFGRMVEPVPSDIALHGLNRIRVVGDTLSFFDSPEKAANPPDFTLRTRQAFGEGTTSLLKKLRVAVVGCSGTGSPTIEQLVRLGIGEIHLVDPDKVEAKNLNRILNTTAEDIGKHKVQVLKSGIEKMGLGTKVFAYPVNLFDDARLTQLLGTMDMFIGCTDSVDSRHLLNNIATSYIVAYLDMGVKLLADGQGGIDKICGNIHFLLPGETLLERGVYDGEDLRAANMLRTSPLHYEQERASGYIKNIVVESPAVISLNMQLSSLAGLELLARLHPYRLKPNTFYAHTAVDLTDWSITHSQYKKIQNVVFGDKIGRGDMPLTQYAGDYVVAT